MRQKVLLVMGSSKERMKEIISLLRQRIFPNLDIELFTNYPQFFSDEKGIKIIHSTKNIVEGFHTLIRLQKRRYGYVVVPLMEGGRFRYKFLFLLPFGKHLLIFNDDLTYAYWRKWQFFCYLFKDIKYFVFFPFRLIFLLISFIYLFLCIMILFGKKLYYSYRYPQNSI